MSPPASARAPAIADAGSAGNIGASSCCGVVVGGAGATTCSTARASYRTRTRGTSWGRAQGRARGTRGTRVLHG
jgi:hypothetical protein